MASQRVVTLTAGVYFREFDISQYIRNLTATKLALIGAASRGEKNKDILVTSLQNGLRMFGVPTEDYPGLLVMREFFQAGGYECHYCAVANGDLVASVDIDDIEGGSKTITAKNSGSDYNNMVAQISYTSPLSQLVTESHTFPALTRTTTVTVGGTKQTGDVVTLTITDAALVGTPKSYAYTVQSGDADLAAVATGLRALLTADAALTNAKIETTISGAVITIISHSLNATAYSKTETGTTTLTISSTTNVLSHTHTKTLTSVPLVPGTVVLKFGSTVVATDNGSGALTFKSGYSQYSGTVDYLTGEVVVTTTNLQTDNAATVNLSSNYWSAFNLQIRYKVKNAAGSVINKYVLESHTGLTLSTLLDSLAGSEYVTMAATLDAFPAAGQYDLAGGDDGKDLLTDADYIGNLLGEEPTGMQVFAFQDQVDINLIGVPGISSQAVRQALVQMCEVTRSDCMFFVDPPAGLSVQAVVDWADGNGDYSAWDVLDSNYGCIYYPWFTTKNSITGNEDHTPPSAAAIRAFVQSDPWQAPAGPNRGRLINITAIDKKLNLGDRVYLEGGRVNPISRLNGMGEMVLGQRTATTIASSLDRISARRMLIRIEKAVTTGLYSLLFEPNNDVTWNRAIMLVQPYLDGLVKKRQIEYGKFYCDETTNSVDDINNNNQMTAVCELKLNKTAEIIVVNFLITAIGANITEQAASILIQ